MISLMSTERREKALKNKIQIPAMTLGKYLQETPSSSQQHYHVC